MSMGGYPPIGIKISKLLYMKLSFLSFLQKYTLINNSFIKDFYKLFNEETIEINNIFIIDYRLLMKWLNLQSKKGFTETLKNSYKVNVDYIIKLENKKGNGGKKKKIYFLTTDAAKRFCLMTKSKKGESVRTYFLELEKTLFKYQNYIIKGLENKIKKLENNQKSQINPKKGVIYVIRALNNNATLYKIGKTINLKQRMKNYNSGLSDDVEMVMIYETDDIDQVEKCIKVLMKKAQYRKYKEVYKVDIDIIKKSIKDCDSKIKEINFEIEKQNERKLKGGSTKPQKKILSENDNLFIVIPN